MIDHLVTDPVPSVVTSFASPALVNGVTRCQDLGTPMGALELGAVTPARQDTIDPVNKDAAEDQQAATLCTAKPIECKHCCARVPEQH